MVLLNFCEGNMKDAPLNVSSARPVQVLTILEQKKLTQQLPS